MSKPHEERRKVREGRVVSNKMQKTVTVRVDRLIEHPRYGKRVTVSKKYYAHSEEPLEIGTKVKIVETRPLSKLKSWRVVETASTQKS